MVMLAELEPGRAAVDLGETVSIAGIAAIAEARRTAKLGATVGPRLAQGEHFLARVTAERRRVYGYTTGFGPLADRAIDPGQGIELQRGLIAHLASGVGSPLAPRHVRALMAVRAATLAKGHSAVPERVPRAIIACLNHDLLPIIPSKGTVGASGDLTPLAHLARMLIGDGPALLEGCPITAAEGLAAIGVAPMTLDGRPGLGLVNGTAAMTGIAAINAVEAGRAVQLALRLTALFADLIGARAEAFHEALARLRPHPGQLAAQYMLETLLDGSTRLRSVDAPGLPQDAYSIRCAQQLIGAVLDVLAFHDGVLRIELNAVTDNPLFLPEEDLVIHGGNFQGQQIAFASDALATAVVQLAGYAERRIARLVDPATNGGLPPFLAAGEPGLSSGFMGAQVTATALVAELRARAAPASIHSLPTNGNNQDVVSLGTIAARKCADALEDCFRVLAIEALALAQAFDLAQRRGDRGHAPDSRALVDWVRHLSAPLENDRPLAEDIERLAAALQSGGAETL